MSTLVRLPIRAKLRHGRALLLLCAGICGQLALIACSSSGGTSGQSFPPAPIADDSADSGDASGDDGGTTPDAATDAPPGCTLPAPTFEHDVLPILDLRCNGCHTLATGQWPLNDYEDVVDWESLVYMDVVNGSMPPLDAGGLPSAERSTVLDWIACGMLR